MKLSYILIIFALLLSSCRAKINTSEISSSVRIDSVYIDRKITVYQQVKDTLIIDHPCDSTGILKPFVQRYNTPQGNVTIEGKNGQIKASIDLKKQADTTLVRSQVHKQEQSQVREVEIIRNRVPIWIIILLVISLVMNIIFLYKKIQNIF